MTTQAEKSLADLNQMLRQDPNNVWALAHRGEIYRLRGCYPEALRDFTCALAQKPAYVWALARRGETLCLLQQYEQALVDFTQAILLSPDYFWALAHRGVVYAWLERYPEALADFNRTLALKPDYLWTLVHRGNLYIKAKRYEEALVDFERAAAIDSTIVQHWYGEYGLLLNYLGRYPETIVSCERELGRCPDDHIVFYSLVVAQALESGLEQTQPNIAQLFELLHNKLQLYNDNKLRSATLYRLGGLNALLSNQTCAFDYLQAAILLDNEPKEIARHDPVWTNWRGNTRFRQIIGE